MTYEYKCSDCEYVQEEIHGMNEKPTITCEKCKSTSMVKQITGGTGTIFKGGGWTTSDSSMKKSMTKKNEQAGEKMKAHKKPVRSLSDLP